MLHKWDCTINRREMASYLIMDIVNPHHHIMVWGKWRDEDKGWIKWGGQCNITMRVGGKAQRIMSSSIVLIMYSYIFYVNVAMSQRKTSKSLQSAT